MTLSHFRERPSGWERRAGKKDEPAPKDRLIRALWFLSSRLQCLRYWLRLDLCSGPRLFFGGELMLYLEGNRIGVNLVRLGCGAENLSSVRLLAGRKQDDGFDDQLADNALVGLAEKRG